MYKSLGILAILMILFSCNSQKKEGENSIEKWKTHNYIDSVQILLTNKYLLKESFGYGASSFLIKAKEDTLLCTAKHLLGDAMGIRPEIKTDSFNMNFKYWKAYPRQNNLSNDTIKGTRLINETVNDIDIIIQDCILGANNNIVVLNPRFTKAKFGEKFEIIGCEYSDFDCYQRQFNATMNYYEGGQIVMKSENNFDAVGFSGAPVIDSNGRVIGVLSGGGEFEGDLYLSIEPLSKIESYLR
jgi:hypothetical protein